MKTVSCPTCGTTGDVAIQQSSAGPRGAWEANCAGCAQSWTFED